MRDLNIQNQLKKFQKAMIEFAKLHVQKALVAAHNQHQLPMEDIDYTLSAYSPDKIK